MPKELRPNDSEKAFLTLAYNRFYDIYDEIMEDSFWIAKDNYRFSRIKDIFAVYAELLTYTPIQWVIDEIREQRPPLEADIGSKLFKCIRNIIIHFPFFDTWNDVWFNKSIVNWRSGGRSIDTFLGAFEGKEAVKYRIWDSRRRSMTYLSIDFPNQYSSNSKIFLRDILSEKEGVVFSIIMMKQILDTQVDGIDESS